MLYLDRICSLCVFRRSQCRLREMTLWAPRFIPGGPVTPCSRRCFVRNKPSVCSLRYLAAKAVQFGSQVGAENAQTRVAKMLTKTKIVLSAALVLSTAFSASAATKARLSHVHRPGIFDIIPDLSASSGAPVRDYIADPIIAPERDRHRTAG
jgi:hypothetical protein